MKNFINVSFLIFVLMISCPQLALPVEGTSAQAEQQGSLTSGLEEFKKILNEKVTGYEEKLKEFKTWFLAFMSFLGLLVSVMALTYTMQSIRSRKDFIDLKDEFEDKKNKIIQELKNDKNKIKDEMNDFMKENFGTLRDTLRATTELNEAKLQLTREIYHIDEPSIRHPLSEKDKYAVERFLCLVDDRRKKLYNTFKKLFKQSDDLDHVIPYSEFDYRIEGMARHFIAPHYPEAKANEQYGKAKDCFEKELKLLQKEIVETKDEVRMRWLKNECNDAECRLGNSYAGLHDYKRAINEYNKIESNSSPNLLIKAEISKVHCYKGLIKFKEAISACREVQRYYNKLTGQKIFSKQESCFWESKYEEANLLVGLGKYKDAKSLYEELCSEKNINEVKKAVQLGWVYLSYGDCLWKGGIESGIDDFKEQKDPINAIYDESIKSLKDNELDKHIGKVLYRKAILSITREEDFVGAANRFEEIIPNGKYDLSFGYDYLVNIFHGYVLLKLAETTTVENNMKERGKKMIENAIEFKRNEIVPKADDYSLCYPMYRLAMGLSMKSESKREAIEKLDKLIQRYDFVRKWATEAGCVDFPEVKYDKEFAKDFHDVVSLP